MCSSYFKLSDEKKEEGEMLACQLESEEEKEKKMVTVAVTIDEELLRRVEASLQLGRRGFTPPKSGY